MGSILVSVYSIIYTVITLLNSVCISAIGIYEDPAETGTNWTVGIMPS